MSEVMHVPEGWEIDIVENLAEIITGDKDTQDKLEDGKYPFYVRSNTVERINTYSFDGEAILTAGDGVGVGKVFHHVDEKFDFHQRVYCIFNFSERLSPKYFFEYFRKNFIERVNKYSAKGSVDSVRYEMISLMEIPVPPIIEQQKIAKILSTLDKAIETSQKLIAKEKNIKKGLMHDLLTNGIDENGKIRSTQTHKYKESELGFIPEGWEVEKLGDLVIEMKSGLSRNLSSQDIGLAVIRSNNITERGMDYTDIKYWYINDPQGADTKNYLLRENDILVNFINSIAQIGKVAKFKKVTNKNFIYTTNILKISVNENVESDYLLNCLKTNRYATYIKSITKPAVNQASFTTQEFKLFKIAIPRIYEQQKISTILLIQDEKIETEEKNLAKLKELKKGLMGDLLNGKVRV
jgi:type I restriction enzyme S subunit